MSSYKKSKLALVFFILIALLIFYINHGNEYLSLNYLQEHKDYLVAYYENHSALFISAYFFCYVFATALFIPVATVLSLLAGAVMGTLNGTILVSFASSIGASISFLLARFLFRDYFQQKYSQQFTSINRGIESEGKFYLFSLRLVPLFPFFLVNILMGLTNIRLLSYYWVSQLAMLPATIIYINAGEQLGEITSLQQVIAPKFLFSFGLIGLLPIGAKKLVSYLRNKKG